jgi:hypothetical protein
MQHFWYYRPEENFPPPVVVRPEEISGLDRLCVACTQTGLSPTEQRRLVNSWCELLPTLTHIRFLWLSSRVPQQLFDAACRVPGLLGLWVKWSAITSLQAAIGATTLRYFHLGSSAKLQSIEPLSQIMNLLWLDLENLRHIQDLTPLITLKQLEGLSIEGSMWTTQRVRTLSPLGSLHRLRFLSLANLKADDRTLQPLFPLTNLEVLRLARWWDPAEVEELRRRNQRLTAEEIGTGELPDRFSK